MPGPASTVQPARAVLAAAIASPTPLDVDPGEQRGFPVADRPRSRNVAPALLIGCNARALPPAFGGAPRCTESVDPERVVGGEQSSFSDPTRRCAMSGCPAGACLISPERGPSTPDTSV